MNNKKIGEYISTLRKNNNLTQRELADKLGVTDKAISKWECGAGYPDISMLKPLSDVLGITVNELLEGENRNEVITEITQEEDAGEEDKENAVTNVLVYADKIMKIKEYNKGKIASAVLAISLFIAIFVCVIVNIAVEHRLSWSYLVIDSCVLGGFLFIPPLLYKKQGLLISLSFLTILIMPFLALIQYITNMQSLNHFEGKITVGTGHILEVSGTTQSEWLWSLSFPIALTWLVIMWLMVILIKNKKINRWFIVGSGTLLCIPGEIITNTVIDKYINILENQVINHISMVSSVIGCISIAGICMVIGLMKQKQKNPYEDAC